MTRLGPNIRKRLYQLILTAVGGGVSSWPVRLTRAGYAGLDWITNIFGGLGGLGDNGIVFMIFNWLLQPGMLIQFTTLVTSATAFITQMNALLTMLRELPYEWNYILMAAATTAIARSITRLLAEFERFGKLGTWFMKALLTVSGRVYQLLSPLSSRATVVEVVNGDTQMADDMIDAIDVIDQDPHVQIGDGSNQGGTGKVDQCTNIHMEDDSNQDAGDNDVQHTDKSTRLDHLGVGGNSLKRGHPIPDTDTNTNAKKRRCN
jgi:hypothetical protein